MGREASSQAIDNPEESVENSAEYLTNMDEQNIENINSDDTQQSVQEQIKETTDLIFEQIDQMCLILLSEIDILSANSRENIGQK